MPITAPIFPRISQAGIAFSTLSMRSKEVRDFLEAHSMPADVHWPGNLARQLFFKGGSLTFKASLSQETCAYGSRFLKAVLHSFDFQAEEKGHVAAVIIYHLCESPEGAAQ